MKKIQYKIAILILLLSTGLFAQKQNHRKIYHEEFTTNKDVIIEVNTRNADVEIETWNKNKVSIEAVIEIEGADASLAEKTLENWQFNAVGNKSEVEISARSSGVSNYLFSKNDNNVIVDGEKHLDLNFEFDFPEVELDNLIELNDDIMVFPEMPEMPNMPMVEFHIENTFPKFDYEKFKKDKNYLKKWQKEMEENLEKNKIKLEKNAEKMEEQQAVLKIELEKMAEQRKKHVEQRKKIMEERLAQRKKHAKQREKHLLIRKKELEKHKAARDKKRDIIIGVLEDRDKIKVKRTITIKAPKDAKFKMNVKYGTLSFPN